MDAYSPSINTAPPDLMALFIEKVLSLILVLTALIYTAPPLVSEEVRETVIFFRFALKPLI